MGCQCQSALPFQTIIHVQVKVITFIVQLDTGSTMDILRGMTLFVVDTHEDKCPWDQGMLASLQTAPPSGCLGTTTS